MNEVSVTRVPDWLNVEPNEDHPAKFTPAILDVIAEFLREGKFEGNVLDPFAGIGGIHQLRSVLDGVVTFAIELEPEWAVVSASRGWTACQDALLDVGEFWRLNAGPDPLALAEVAEFHAIITSPTYGNRMADKHTPGKCRACNGTGEQWTLHQREGGSHTDIVKSQCDKCKGTGRESSKRLTYRHRLGRALTENNSGGMQWGHDYQWFHQRAWTRMVHRLEPGGLLIVNVKDHPRAGVRQEVVKWHRETINRKKNMEFITEIKVPVKGMGFGANQHNGNKIDHESVLVFRKAGWREDGDRA